MLKIVRFCPKITFIQSQKKTIPSLISRLLRNILRNNKKVGCLVWSDKKLKIFPLNLKTHDFKQRMRNQCICKRNYFIMNVKGNFK